VHAIETTTDLSPTDAETAVREALANQGTPTTSWTTPASLTDEAARRLRAAIRAVGS
jgi:hypothetical protein